MNFLLKGLIISMLGLGLVSCAVVKTPQATGGSRADGVIEMSYQYGAFQKPEVNWQEAQQKAASRCGAWGYNSAESFGGSISKCNGSNQYGCNSWIVTTKYQCVNR